MASSYKFGIQMKKEREDKQANMHSVIIRISSNYDFVISKFVKAWVNVKSCLQETHFLVLKDLTFRQTIRVEHFPFQRKYGLCIYVTNFCDTSTCWKTFSDKDTWLFPLWISNIAIMYTAVSQFRIMKIGFLCMLTDNLGNTHHLLVPFFIIFYLLFDYPCNISVFT